MLLKLLQPARGQTVNPNLTSCIFTRGMSPSWPPKNLLLVWYPAKWVDNLMTSALPWAFWNIAGVLTGNPSSNGAFLHLSDVWRVNKDSWLENGPQMKMLLRMETDDFQPEKCKCTREYIWIRPYWKLSMSIALSCLSELNICKLCMWKMPSEQCSKPCSMKS